MEVNKHGKVMRGRKMGGGGGGGMGGLTITTVTTITITINMYREFQETLTSASLRIGRKIGNLVGNSKMD